jgi:hypothetical protein
LSSAHAISARKAAGRMRTPGAALEEHGDARPLERVLEQPGIVLRRAQRDGHAIERHAAARFAQHTTGDLDRLAPFSRRRKQFHVVQRLGGWRRGRGEQMAAQAVEAGAGFAIERHGPAQRRQRAQREGVAVRDGDERVGRTRDQRLDEGALGGSGDGDIDQQETALRIRMGAAAGVGRSVGRRAKKCGAVDGRCCVKLRVETLEQIGKIGADVDGRAHRSRRHHRERQLFERARQRAGKSGHVRHRREVRQRLLARGIEERARRHRLNA